jgi:hypothetical protein
VCLGVRGYVDFAVGFQKAVTYRETMTVTHRGVNLSQPFTIMHLRRSTPFIDRSCAIIITLASYMEGPGFDFQSSDRQS